jgi:tetratricopeptide (TPR) repeat protein
MSHVPRELEYDVFISFARPDNEGDGAHKVSALLRAVVDEHRAKYRCGLRIFFDEQPSFDIGERQDAILRGLDRSTTLLVILSPAYFDSPWCRREWERHLQCCRDNGLEQARVISVSIADVSALHQLESHRADDGWTEFLRQAPTVDCQTWWPEWSPPAESDHVRQAIGQIAQAIYDCLKVIPDRLTPVVIYDSPSASESHLEEPVLDRPTTSSAPHDEEPPPVVEPEAHPAASIELYEMLVTREGRRELRPDLARLYMDRGDALAELGRHQEALESYAAALELYKKLVHQEGRWELEPSLARALHSSASHGGPLPSHAGHPNAPVEISENVQFTVFRPKAVPPSQWRTLLAFAHLAELPADADPSELDPLKVVEELAEKALGPDFQDYGKTTQDSTSAVPRQGQIVFIPTMEGVDFNPPRCEFQWVENLHKAEFRFRASPKLEGKTARGRLTVFLGSVILAEIPLQFRVDREAGPADSKPDERASARPYRNIFASYSHRDVEIVHQFEVHARALGDRYLRDVVDLRAGQVWNDELMRLIQQANVFQLFWSHNAMRSPFVRREWEYALSLRRPEFIRPTYWETPFPEDSATGLPPERLRRIHFHFIGTLAQKDSRSDAEIALPALLPEPPSAPDPRDSIPMPHAGRPWLRTRERRRPRPAIWLGAGAALALLAAASLMSFRSTSAPPFPIESTSPDEFEKSAGHVLEEYRRMGTRALEEGKLVDARSWFERGLKICQDQAQAHPNDIQVRRDWSALLRVLADIALRDGKIEEACGYLQHDLKLWQSPTFNATQEAKSQLLHALKQGETFLRQRKTEEARRSFQNYLELADRLAKPLPAGPNGKPASLAPAGP